MRSTNSIQTATSRGGGPKRITLNSKLTKPVKATTRCITKKSQTTPDGNHIIFRKKKKHKNKNKNKTKLEILLDYGKIYVPF